MEDDPIVISSGLVVTPESVANRSFGTTFRGYNPDEVRAFLKRVADELDASASRQAELRRALQEALARAAHPEVDEAVLTAALGEHAARLITSAREQAAAMVQDAEERAARLMRDAEEKVTRMRREAETLMARRVEEAEAVTSRLREAAEADAAALRDRARADAEAEVSSAQARGKEMLAEAKAVRERMFSDLARRRRAAEIQIEQLRAGRDRLVQAYEVVRRTVAEATRELEAAEPEARMAAEAVARRAVESPIPDRLEGAASGQADAPAGEESPSSPTFPGATPASAAAASSPAPAGSTPAAPPGAVAGGGLGGTAASSVTRGSPFPPRGPSRRLQIPSLDLSGPAIGLTAPVRRPQAVADVTETGDPPSELATGEVPAVGSPPTEPAALDDLFARIRADREAARRAASEARQVAGSPSGAGGGDAGDQSGREGAAAATASPAGAEVNGPEPNRVESDGGGSLADPPPSDAGLSDAGLSDAGSGASTSKGDVVAQENVRQQRDDALEPIEADLARRLKRVLQDEQNEVLDALRRQRRPAPLSALPDIAAQRDRYGTVARPLLEQAAAAGARLVSGGTSPDPFPQTLVRAASDVAGDLAAELVVGLRDRLEATLSQDDSAGDQGDEVDRGTDESVFESVSATYRQWKLQEVEPLARHHAHAAFAAGGFQVVPEGTPLRWIVDDEGPCPDCDDNALAGPTPRGDAFPTGQAHPPAHPGCRCLLVAALP